MVDDIASVYLDIVPIRTRVRGGGEEYFTEEMVGEYSTDTTCDAKKEWGDAHVLPEVEASGRWENIPVCAPPMPDRSPNDVGISDDSVATSVKENRNSKALPVQPITKKHTLIGCVWASTQFTTKGNAKSDSSTSSRLLEWLTYHLYVADMDHIYVYDNSGAHTDQYSLANITNLFPPDRVTRIDWPFRVCNNNIPAHRNTGERSSQYAAEASCRLRFGPYTEWLASFDTDEYLVPMGKWNGLKQWLAEGVGPETNILSFRSTKAFANYDYMQPYWDGGDCGADESDAKCVVQRPDALYLETYNCGEYHQVRAIFKAYTCSLERSSGIDSERCMLFVCYLPVSVDFGPPPKPDRAERAKKQIYRPSYVLNHYVHYSTATQGTAMYRSEAEKKDNGPVTIGSYIPVSASLMS